MNKKEIKFILKTLFLYVFFVGLGALYFTEYFSNINITNYDITYLTLSFIIGLIGFEQAILSYGKKNLDYEFSILMIIPILNLFLSLMYLNYFFSKYVLGIDFLKNNSLKD